MIWIFNSSKIPDNKSTNADSKVHEVAITGVHGYVNATVNSRMTRPVDLTESVEVAKVCYLDENLTNFQDEVLHLVQNEKKVLIRKENNITRRPTKKHKHVHIN